MEKKEREETAAKVTCKPFGCRCNICGGSIPEGDSVCVNGHEPGKGYPPAPVSGIVL